MSEIFIDLESNNKNVVDNAKLQLRELFKTVNEPWLLNGLYDFYLKTSSVRFSDILVNIKEPHHNFLFDRLLISLKSEKHELVQALTLLGHVAITQPTWLYKLPDHSLLPEILKLLKNEVELVPLISALLLLIVLLPIIPSSMIDYLHDMFEIFSRLAAWNCSPGKFAENQMIHLQVALYALFLRLYGMYPCNLVVYLKTKYKDGQNPVFVHTIRPMLDTVRMHPSLVVGSIESEKSTERWKKMGVHDVIVECERFSLDLTERCPHDCQFTSGFRSRSGTTNSSMEPSYHLQTLKHLPSTTAPNIDNNFFTPSSIFHTPVTKSVPTNIPQPHIQGIHSSNFPSQEGTSPPEPAIEATPETTPVRDPRFRVQPLNSNVPRALTSFSNKNRTSGSLGGTPTHSQPSSPMRKDTGFTFVTDSRPKKETLSQKLNILLKDRAQVNENDPSYKIKPIPTSPVRIVTDSNSKYTCHQRTASPISQEDEEVALIVSKSDPVRQPTLKCDSVVHDDSTSDVNYEDDQEHGSPCTEGGLHMPNSKSINNFAKNMRRLRHHSQCNTESERIEISTGSSPGNCSGFTNSTTVRRANSCPEMKKSPVISTKDNISKTLDEKDEEIISEDRVDCNSNGINVQQPNEAKKLSCSTQTENFWPMPYEPLFLEIFPSLGNEIKPSPAPSPAPFNLSQDRYQPSIYEILDKYIDTAVKSNEKESKQGLKEHVQLLHQHLLFERHRRETHAYRNRRLLADAKSTRQLEDCNSALRDQVHLHQKEIDNLRSQLDISRKEKTKEDEKLTLKIQYWEDQYKKLLQDNKKQREKIDNFELNLTDLKNEYDSLGEQKEQVEYALLNSKAEVNIAREQVVAGEKGRTELELVNKQLLLIGELQQKYQERFDELSSMRRCDQELEHLKESFGYETKNLNQQLDAKTVTLEACQARLSELEQNIHRNEQTITLQKRILTGVNDEYNEKLKAVESKYKTQLEINRTYEQKLLELRQRNDLLINRSIHSPDTSSCHEVNATATDRTAGLSAHSSPLSTSLASSEGSVAFHDGREVKNLQQTIADQKESTSKQRQEDEIDLGEPDGQLASSKID